MFIMSKENIPGCCEGCNFWEKHKSSCWYYWELKKNCTMHSDKQ